jgi:hypothetical protein
MIAGEPPRPQGFRRTLYNLIQSRITSKGCHNLALTQLQANPITKHTHTLSVCKSIDEQFSTWMDWI